MQSACNAPDRLSGSHRNAIVVAAAAQALGAEHRLNEVARQRSPTDPDFHARTTTQHGVRAPRGLRLARMIGHITLPVGRRDDGEVGRALRRTHPVPFRRAISENRVYLPTKATILE